MKAFTTYVHATSYMFSAFEPFLKEAQENPEQFFEDNMKLLNDLTRETKKVYAEAQQILKQGQNKLISLNSYDKVAAQEIIDQIKASEANLSLQEFLEESFNLFGIQSEEIKNDIILLTPTDNMILPSFPGVSDTGSQITFNRNLALKDDLLRCLSKTEIPALVLHPVCYLYKNTADIPKTDQSLTATVSTYLRRSSRLRRGLGCSIRT